MKLLSLMKKTAKTVGFLALLGSVFWLGSRLGGGPGGGERVGSGEAASAPASTEAPATIWTCSMHPQIRLPAPGKCPICGMDLIPMSGGGGDEESRRLVMSPAAKKLAEIVTTPVERRAVSAEVRMVGKVDYDETRVRSVAAWVPGRIDRIFVDFTGVEVREGDHLSLVYSPKLYEAQQELFQARDRLQENRAERSAFLRQSDQRAFDSAKEKLRLWGISEAEIGEILERRAPDDHVEIDAPIAGVVIHKAVKEGDYVQEGSPLYRVADLSHLWVRLDAYESDLMWIRYGQDVSITTEAYPGETFHGWISFIDPVLDVRTRTVKVRVNVANPDRKLKPEMFVHAVVRARVAAGGKVVSARLVGKWVGPMHPEVVRDGPGKCDVCGMPLVPAEQLGYVSIDPDTPPPLVVPASAVLKTGRRAVVYVEVPDSDRPTFEGREIVLGPRTGDTYLVDAGLEEGERVVVQGNFKIDSALQIQARPSMMNPPSAGEGAGETPAPGAAGEGDGTDGARPFDPSLVPATALVALDPLYEDYLALQRALASDDLDAARVASKRLEEAVGGVDMMLFAGDAHVAWMEISGHLKAHADQASSSEDLAGAREAFAALSAGMSRLARRFGHGGSRPLFLLHCPMALGGRGADWLQDEEATHNPFFGTVMPRCGSVEERLASRGEER